MPIHSSIPLFTKCWTIFRTSYIYKPSCKFATKSSFKTPPYTSQFATLYCAKYVVPFSTAWRKRLSGCYMTALFFLFFFGINRL